MQIIDLSQSVGEKSLIYPRDKENGAGFELTQVESMDRGDNVNGEVVKAGVHVMTHLDSPGHQIKDGKTLDAYPLEKFIQKALLINLEGKKEIKKQNLEPYQDKIKNVGALIVRTGFDKIAERYEKDASFREKTTVSVADLPSFSQECAEWLAAFPNLSLVGTDSLTVGNKAVHGAFLQKDILLIESLNLQNAPENFTLYCFPWKIKNVNGAPCRAVALNL